jgi:D-alanine-D-alanine ligase
MRVAILFNAVAENAPVDELDVLIQVDAVSAALARLGHEVSRVPCTLELSHVLSRVRSLKPDVVFNLVESLEGHGRLIFLVPSMLDAVGVPYTGSPAEALFLTSHKVLAKERFRGAGLPTPDWFGPWPDGSMSPVVPPRRGRAKRGDYIVKSVWEHASFGLDDDLVIRGADDTVLRRSMEVCAERLRGQCFAEAFIDGREFNISILAGRDGPEVLPLAEIEFIGFPEGKPKIVSYKAKWAEESPEYRGTPRTFEFAASDAPILEELRRLTPLCWSAFGLRGYARVDYRVDEKGRPYILEINANPCISPDSGFVAAAGRSGLDYDGMVRRILEDAARGRRGGRAGSGALRANGKPGRRSPSPGEVSA